VPFLGITLNLGRRKSWIVPIQAIVGVLLYLLGLNVDRLLLVEKPNVYLITFLFFTLVLFAATQGECSFSFVERRG
jgi:PAT family acetyl-CoA transporter-like MFS transporter 1